DRDRINVRWACDRRVHFVGSLASEADVQQGMDNLQAERVVAFTVNEATIAKADEFLRTAEKRASLETPILPVAAESSVVKFGSAQAAAATASQLLEAIRAARRRPEEE